MTVNDCYFVEWKEQFISQERGNRVVHYYLKNSAGESILAVVGTERSVRHMFYVVADEFREVCGKEGSIHAGFKWRSRREVVDWLTSMLSKQHLQGDRSVSPTHSMIPNPETTDSAINEVSALRRLRTQLADDNGLLISNFKGHNSDIVWSGVAWTCGKQLKHYPAFCRNGIKIVIQSFVFVMAKGENQYIAYLEDMYEDRKGLKKVKVRWFHHNQEVKGVVPVRNPHPREVFITPYSQVISAECVDGPAAVLTREHYEKCFPAFSPPTSDRIHLCFRQFRSNKVKPFDLTKLRGYYDQPILSCLHLDSFQNPESKCNNFAEEDEELSAGDDVKVGAKRTSSGRGSPQSWIDRQGVMKLIRRQQMMVYKTLLNVDYAQPEKRFLSLKQDECQPRCNTMYNVDDKIELLCQDSGIRGCWFRCTVAQVSQKQIKVQYDDVQGEEGNGNLEEWVPAFKLAMPDKLGMRHSGRPTIRPVPSCEGQGELAIEIGAAVDAWWSDGWWEGVVIGIDTHCGDSVQVYFPGEGSLLIVCKKNLRISRDWLGDRWINIKAKPDISSTIFAVNSSNTRLSMSPSTAKDVNSVGYTNSSHEVSVSDKSIELNIVEEKLVCFEDGAKYVDSPVHGNKLALQKENGIQAANVELPGGYDDKNSDDDKYCGDDDENKDADSDDRNTEVFGTSGQDCKAIKPTEVAV